MPRRLTALAQRHEVARRTLHAVSPLATLDRGYAIVSRAEDGKLLRDTTAAPIGTRIIARLGRGHLEAIVTGAAPADPPQTP